jgi:hypothetical protein
MQQPPERGEWIVRLRDQSRRDLTSRRTLFEEQVGEQTPGLPPAERNRYASADDQWLPQEPHIERHSPSIGMTYRIRSGSSRELAEATVDTTTPEARVPAFLP